MLPAGDSPLYSWSSSLSHQVGQLGPGTAGAEPPLRIDIPSALAPPLNMTKECAVCVSLCSGAVCRFSSTFSLNKGGSFPELSPPSLHYKTSLPKGVRGFCFPLNFLLSISPQAAGWLLVSTTPHCVHHTWEVCTSVPSTALPGSHRLTSHFFTFPECVCLLWETRCCPSWPQIHCGRQASLNLWQFSCLSLPSVLITSICH